MRYREEKYSAGGTKRSRYESFPKLVKRLCRDQVAGP